MRLVAGGDVIGQIAVRDGYALGASGGARREYDISLVAGHDAGIGQEGGVVNGRQCKVDDDGYHPGHDIGLPRDDGSELCFRGDKGLAVFGRSEEHTSELQSLMRISYAVFCLKKKKKQTESHYLNAEDNRQ